MAEKINPSSYKQLLSMVRQAKQSGSQELRLPIKFLDEVIIELNEKFFERLTDNNIYKDDNIKKSSQKIISGGTFK